MSLLLGLVIFSFILTSLAIVPFINLLYQLKFYKSKSALKGADKTAASEHIISKARTPEGGGLLILIMVSLLFAFIFPLVRYLGVYITQVYPLNEELNIIFFTFLSWGLLGLYDDVVGFFQLDRDRGFAGLRQSHKFAIQGILAAITASLLFFNLGIEIINVPFIGVLHLGWLYIPLATFLIMGFANAVNITDGMDGLAGGLLMITLFGFWMLSASILDTPLSMFIALWIGALMAFLYFNVYPARIFMGDVGALAFGATFAVVGLLVGKIVALIVMGGLFIVVGSSSLLQILSVKMTGKRLFPVAPLHYWLLKIGWSEPKIVQRAWLANIMLVIFGVWLAMI
jgi:phospho-N-acetylmuramoyl-pentapeptide-transferase